MASGEQPSLQKGQKVGSNSSNSRNECDEGQWMSLPNNLEIGPRNMPPKKQRNREKLRSVQGNSSASASNASDNLSCTPIKFQNLQRTKCNTETWLKDQLANDERTKHRSFDSDEAFSDIDASVTRRGNMNLPVSHTFHSSDRSLDNQRPPSQRSMIENENTKSVKEECKKNEADSAIVFERLSHLMEFISDATSLYQDLEVNAEPAIKDDLFKLREAVKHASEGGKEQKILQTLETDCGGFANGISPSSSISKASISKDVFLSNDECAGLPCEEECINECSHLFEKFKHPDDKLLALKLQETLLYHMRKKAENKLASLQTSLNRHADGVSVISQNLSADDVLIHPSNDDHSGNASSQRNSDASDQRQWLDENTSQCQSLDQTQLQINSFRSRAEDLERLHVSLENIKKRVLSIHQIADSKNMTTSLSSDDFDMSDVGEKVAAVELERKKLKNKLIELQKKQKRNDELLKELSYLKEVTSDGRACNNEDDGSNCNTSSRVPQVQQSKDKRKLEISANCSSENISKIQATLQSLEGMVNIISQDCNVDSCSNIESTESLPRLETAPSSTNQKLSMIHSTLQNLEGMMSSISQDSNLDAVSNIETSETHPKSVQSRQTVSTSVKRDNVQKKQNSGFPARRHYEAEGRANEDADLPAATPTSLPSLEKWCDNSAIDKKIRKHVGPKHVKVLNDIMSSIQDTENSDVSLPAEQLRILSTIKPEEQCSNVEDSGDDSCDSGVGTNMISHGRMPENLCTGAKEICAEGHKSLLLDVDNHKRRESAPSEDFETGARRKQKLDKLASQFQQLLQLFPTSERKNDDLVRSSGEGDYAQNRNHPANPVVPEHARNSKCWDNSFPRQDNLQLTRQNIVSFDSQNHNSSSNIHNRDCNSMKKDNINNLSGKMGKLGMQNTMLGLNSGPVIASSSASGPSAPVYNLDTISTFSSEMNQSHCLSNNELEGKTAIDVLKKPPKKRGFKRNHDSQLLSNSSVDSEPLDGSSSAMAADNTVAATWGGSSTQDYFEDENDERVESLDEEDGTNAVGNNSNKSRNAELEDQYHHNMHLYIESVANVQEKKLPKPTLSRAQPLLHGNVRNTATKMTRPISKKRSLSNVTSELYNEAQCSSLIPNSSENSHPNTSRFLQQLKSQVDQLNALCQQQQLFHDANKTNFSVPPMHTSQRNMPYPCPPPQSIPDISQPHNHQLLLCLSQCYHALYMQQLEIQHLQRCMHHNMEDVFHSTSNPSSQAAEDMTFRPWPMSTLSNPLLPSSLYPAEQTSPMSFPCMQSPLKTYASSNNPSYPRVSSTPPVRAVIHPASQENATSQETLNNQVPPRTRANNFWDNFRSYSRQNLLSASSNIKRNESSGLSVAPQIRQVHPLVPNESFSRSPDLPNQFSSSEINRSLPNSEAQDFRRSKRSNSSSFVASSANNNSLGAQRKPLPQVINASCARSMTSNTSFPHNVERVPSNSNPSSVNLIQLYPVQHDSKVGSFSSIRPTTATESTISQAFINESAAGQSEHSDFLVGLFREAQAIQSEGRRQSALQLIRALAVKDRRELEVAAENKIQNDHPTITNRTDCGTGAANPTGETCSQLCNQSSETDTDKTASKTPCEASVPWSNQNLPTAAISPLNKHSTQRPVSTGAVRKKPRQSSACSSDSAANLMTNTMHDPPELDNPWENTDVGISSQYRAPSECASKIVEKVISDLQSIFPYGQMKEDPCPGFWAAVNAYILDSLKAMFPLSHKTQAALQRALDHFLSRFSGMRFIECEFEFLKCLSEFLYELVACYMSTGRFTSPLYTSNFDEEVLEDDKMHELCVKMPADPYDKTRELSIKMPVDENDVFSSQFRTVFSQNVGDGNSSSDMALPSVRAVSPENVECDCGPGIELEHEVEAGTEADLAEADQSPGQQGNSASGISSTAEAWSVDQTSEFLAKNFGAANPTMMISSEKYDSEASGELSAVAELGLALQEVCLDDIPTKLCPTSEEEHHCEPLRDEQSVPLPMQEMNDAEENAENKCDNELPNAK